MVCVLALTGFATYVLYPAVPPWMAAQHGNLGESNRMIGSIWHHIPVAHSGAVFEHGQALREQRRGDAVAARRVRAPLQRCISGGSSPRWVRPLLALYPLAMAFALVYSGEHYVVDCIAGWVYAVVAFCVGQLRVRAGRAARAPRSSRRSSIERPPAALLRRHRRG